jgi:hypothetical protein
MVSEKGVYWMALGVLALGLSNSLVNQHGDCLRGFAGRAVAVAEGLSAQAMSRVEMAEMMLGKGEAGVARTQATVGQAQVRLASVQTVLARHQAEMTRVQGERIQVITQERVNRALARCPRKTITVEVPQPPAIPNDGTI